MMSEKELSSLNFNCQGCGGCCSGESGFVFLSEEEVLNICNYLKVEKSFFLKNYTHWIKFKKAKRLSLKEEKNFDCIFLKENRCEIYPVRPLQCKSYPFWERVISSQKTWEQEKNYCPGIGKGERFIPLSKISDFILKQRNFPYIKK